MRRLIYCTPRQYDIARLVAEGLSNSEIAERLGVSANTVKFHLKELYNRIGRPSRPYLASEFSKGNLCAEERMGKRSERLRKTLKKLPARGAKSAPRPVTYAHGRRRNAR